MPKRTKKTSGHSYELMYETLDIKRSTYREWMGHLMPNPKWSVLSSQVLLFIRILRDVVRVDRLLPSEMNPKDWDTVYEIVMDKHLNQLSELNLFADVGDGSVVLKHRDEGLVVKRGIRITPLSDTIEEHLLGLANIGSSMPTNVSLLYDRTEQYYDTTPESKEVS